MRLPYVRETTVLHPKNRELSWKFLVLPAEVETGTEGADVPTLAKSLRFKLAPRLAPSQLPFVVASSFNAQSTEEALSIAQSLTEDIHSKPEKELEALRFAEQIVFQKFVPSPHEGSEESLASIVASVHDGDENHGAALAEYDGEVFLLGTTDDLIMLGGSRLEIVNASLWEWLKRIIYPAYA